MDEKGNLEGLAAENVIFAVGGPGGLYKTSVYPAVHTGAIGLALRAGARAQSLPESQYGLASTQFRWNVSGTYMQVIPRFISTGPDGRSDEREFMSEYFDSVGAMNAHGLPEGLSVAFRLAQNRRRIVHRGHPRVHRDRAQGPPGVPRLPEESGRLRLPETRPEALQYLTNSKGLLETPIARLRKMNPGAIELYRDHGIDLVAEPLEIAVCAQHNNGGVAANHWWESLNVRHLFPVGEVNGSHGVYRPGGSALNSGQVAGFRAAEYIAARYNTWTLDAATWKAAAAPAVTDTQRWIDTCRTGRGKTWQEERAELQQRMSRAGAHIRSAGETGPRCDRSPGAVCATGRKGVQSRNGEGHG